MTPQEAAAVPADDPRRKISWYEWHPEARETLVTARGRLRALGIRQPEEVQP